MRRPGALRASVDALRLTLRLALRGIAYRRLTASVVLVLAVVAATAAVVAPLYARAAEESIARGALRRADVFARAVHADVSPNAARVALPASGTVDSLTRRLHGPVFGTPRLSQLTPGIMVPARGPQAGGDVEVPFMDRPGLCEHLPMATGRCPASAHEVAMTARSARLLGLRLGDSFSAALREVLRPDGSQQVARLTLVGTVEPFAVDDDYWVGRSMFGYYPIARPAGLGELPPITDVAWMGEGAGAALGVAGYSIDVPVDGSVIDLDSAPAVSGEVVRTAEALGLVGVSVTSQLPALVESSAHRSQVVRVAAPLAAVQLVLLAWVILAHVVSAATQERAPELGLAKLRGLTPRRTVRFGLAEVVVLLLLSAPLGTLLGWWLVHEVAVYVLEPGVELRLSPAVVASVALGVLGGIAAAAVAAHGVARHHVAELLRRVPGGRRRRGAGAMEGVVLALVVAGIVQLAVAPGSAPGPVASAAPGMIALGGALLAAQIVRRLSRNRAGRALDRGRPGSLLGWASVSRRAGNARTTAVLAAALCLMLVGVQAWAVAARERQVRALAETGAAVVLDVRATSAAQLLRVVRAADPGGRYAMAAMQLPGSNQTTRALAVDATRADAVLGFAGRGPSRIADVVRGDLPASVAVRPGGVGATVTVGELAAPTPLVLSVTVEGPSGWQEVALGPLRRGTHAYRGTVPASCASGCRLVGLAVSHPGADISTGRATLSVTGLSGTDPRRPLATDLGRPGAWRTSVVPASGASARLSQQTSAQGGSRGALTAQVEVPAGYPARLVHGDSPDPLPALGGQQSPVHDGGLVSVTGVDGAPTTVRRVAVAPFVPGLGRDGVLVDLELALRAEPTSQADGLQVLLSRDDRGAERRLTAELAASGAQVLDRSSSADALRVLDREGAVLSLLLFVACGAVAVLVAVGALLVAAFVGARERAAEVAALRSVGVRRRVVRRGLLLENVAGVGVALLCAVVAATVAVVVVLPVLPLADETSQVVTARTTPDPTSALWSVLGVAALLLVVALGVASAQLRSGTVDRMREGAR